MSLPETPRSQNALLLEIAELKRQLATETSRTQRSLPVSYTHLTLPTSDLV